jgi:hypothetical protein
MKIRDILSEEESTKILGVAGEKAKLANGTEVDVSTLAPDMEHPGQFKMPEIDPTKITPGATVSMGTEDFEDPTNPDLVSGGNNDVGNDGTGAFLNDVRDAGAEQAQGYGPEGGERVADEGIFGFGNKTPEEWAKTSPQMAKLLQFRAKAVGTPYADQVEKRIQLLKDRLDMDAGEVAGPGGTPKDPVPPEQFDMKQLREADDVMLQKMRVIAGLR